MKLFICDTETSGTNPKTDRVVEVAYKVINTDDWTMLEAYEALQDIGTPLSEENKAITNLTDEDLAGQSINWERVSDAMENSDFACAFNAAFDRSFIEMEITTTQSVRRWLEIRRATQSAPRPSVRWACAMQHIPWRQLGIKNQPSLRLIGYEHDAISHDETAHRAMADVNCLIRILRSRLIDNHALPKALRDKEGARGSSLQTYGLKNWEVMVDTARIPVALLACRTRYFSEDFNNVIKSKGFRFSRGMKRWWTTAPAAATHDTLSEVSVALNNHPNPKVKQCLSGIDVLAESVDILDPEFREKYQLD